MALVVLLINKYKKILYKNIILYVLYIYMSRVDAEKSTSKDKSSNQAIIALYDVVSTYNGVIRTIIERTEPKGGKWSTRKSVDQSTVMYVAEVLKGLKEPLKHLEFQLNQTNDPELASLQTMMHSLVEVIDESPPFKALDVDIFKNGIPNYEGLADDLDITNSKQYLSLLKSKKKKLQFKYDNMVKVSRQNKAGELSKSLVKQMTDSLDVLNKEIRKTTHLVDAKLQDLYVDGVLLSDIDALMNAFDEFELPEMPPEKVLLKNKLMGVATEEPFSKTDWDKLNQSKEVGGDKLLKELKREKKILEKQKEHVEKGYVARYPDFKDAEGKMDSLRLPTSHRQEYLELLENISKIGNRLEVLGDKDEAKRDAKNEMVMARQKAEDEENAAEAAQPGGAEGAPPGGAEGAPQAVAPDGAAGMGAGRPLADLLANPKQQYNFMQRPLSDDQKIQNDMIKANRNWQLKNNGPHDTPIGNLNPFLAQDEASKYSYEVLLAAKNAVEHPETNALGANVSLLQGPISVIEGSGKKSKALMQLKKVAIDEKNNLYKRGELGSNGMIPEEKEDQFKLPEIKPRKRK